MRNDKIDRTFPSIRLADEPTAQTPTDMLQNRLKELSDRLDQVHLFKKGQFLKWKPGLKNRKFPDYGEPVIVNAVLPAAIFDPSENQASSPYFQEPLTIVIGTFLDDDLIEFRVDGRRFEPFEN